MIDTRFRPAAAADLPAVVSLLAEDETSAAVARIPARRFPPPNCAAFELVQWIVADAARGRVAPVGAVQLPSPPRIVSDAR